MHTRTYTCIGSFTYLPFVNDCQGSKRWQGAVHLGFIAGGAAACDARSNLLMVVEYGLWYIRSVYNGRLFLFFSFAIVMYT